MHPIFIKANNRKNIRLIAICCLFILIGTALLQLPHYAALNTEELFNLRLIACSAITFFIVMILIFFRRIFQKNRGIYLNEEALIDNTFKKGSSKIYWKDVINILTHSNNDTGFILLFVHNPETYMQKATGFQKTTMQLHNKTMGTPIAIMIDELTVETEELHELILSFVDKFGPLVDKYASQ